jgi:hypothetical protein
MAIMAPVRTVASIKSLGKQKRLPPMPMHEFGRRLGLNEYSIEHRPTWAMPALYLNYGRLSIQKLPEFGQSQLVDLNKIRAFSVVLAR